MEKSCLTLQVWLYLMKWLTAWKKLKFMQRLKKESEGLPKRPVGVKVSLLKLIFRAASSQLPSLNFTRAVNSAKGAAIASFLGLLCYPGTLGARSLVHGEPTNFFPDLTQMHSLGRGRTSHPNVWVVHTFEIWFVMLCWNCWCTYLSHQRWTLPEKETCLISFWETPLLFPHRTEHTFGSLRGMKKWMNKYDWLRYRTLWLHVH